MFTGFSQVSSASLPLFEAKEINGCEKQLKNEMAQVEKDSEVMKVKEIFEKKNKDFIGAAKISRRDYPMLSHSYFVIREEKDGKVEFTLQQQFHKKLSEKGFICSGGMKDVYKLKNPKTGEVSGVRSVLKENMIVTSQTIQAVQEFRDDPNLCGGHYLTYKSRKSDRVLHLFLHPYMNGGNLVQWSNKVKRLDRSLQIKIMLQVCRGVKKMHDSGWIHRDIKPDNILFNTDPTTLESTFKLADLDSAEKPLQDSKLSRFGTYSYLAPEILGKDIVGLEPGKKCDIYSLGMTFWFIKSLTIPTFNLDGLGYLDPPLTYKVLILKGFPEPRKQTAIQRLIYDMINPADPEDRPNIDEVISRFESLP